MVASNGFERRANAPVGHGRASSRGRHGQARTSGPAGTRVRGGRAGRRGRPLLHSAPAGRPSPARLRPRAYGPAAALQARRAVVRGRRSNQRTHERSQAPARPRGRHRRLRHGHLAAHRARAGGHHRRHLRRRPVLQHLRLGLRDPAARAAAVRRRRDQRRVRARVHGAAGQGGARSAPTASPPTCSA